MQRQPRPNQSLVVVRWVIAALGAALGVALIVRGSVVIGGLVLALTVVRGWMFVTWRRRMAERASKPFS